MRDAGPDAWGRRVIEHKLERSAADLQEIDYLLHGPQDGAGYLRMMWRRGLGSAGERLKSFWPRAACPRPRGLVGRAAGERVRSKPSFRPRLKGLRPEGGPNGRAVAVSSHVMNH